MPGNAAGNSTFTSFSGPELKPNASATSIRSRSPPRIAPCAAKKTIQKQPIAIMKTAAVWSMPNHRIANGTQARPESAAAPARSRQAPSRRDGTCRSRHQGRTKARAAGEPDRVMPEAEKERIAPDAALDFTQERGRNWLGAGRGSAEAGRGAARFPNAEEERESDRRKK